MTSVDFNPANSPGAAGQPAWDVALLYPTQGSWTEEDYWALEGGRLIDFDDGHVEIHDVPTVEHQRIVLFLYRQLYDYVEKSFPGEVLTAPLPVHLWKDKYREPDLAVVSSSRAAYRGYPHGADLVVEVVSEDSSSRRRDLEIKPNDYARAEVPEYWIVDPQEKTIRVGKLVDQQYEWTVYLRGQHAASALLTGLTIQVSNTLDAAKSGSEKREARG